MTLLLILAALCHAETLPQAILDPAASEVSEYLHQEIRKDRAAAGQIAADNTWTGTSSFSGAGQSNSSWTFAGGVFGNVHNSSQSVRMSGVNWGSTGLVCRSSLTIVGSTITIHAAGSVSHAAGNAIRYAGYLIDGVCPVGWTCSNTCTSNNNPWGNNQDDGGQDDWTIQARETAAYGVHTVCVWACSSAGTTAGGNLEFWVEAN